MPTCRLTPRTTVNIHSTIPYQPPPYTTYDVEHPTHISCQRPGIRYTRPQNIHSTFDIIHRFTPRTTVNTHSTFHINREAYARHYRQTSIPHYMSPAGEPTHNREYPFHVSMSTVRHAPCITVTIHSTFHANLPPYATHDREHPFHNSISTTALHNVRR